MVDGVLTCSLLCAMLLDSGTALPTCLAERALVHTSVSSADGGQRQASGRKKAVAALWAGISSVRSSKAPDSPRDSGGRESSRGERADRWSGDRQSERASALTQSSEHKEDDKVEAFRLRFHGNEYKCWAHGEEERAEIVAKLRELKRELKREEEERIRTIGRNTAVLW